ncbi:MAG: C4-type zinc ribbon domain-containing protein [Acidimicrobiales bacterium]
MSETDDLRSLMETDRWIERVTSQRSHLPEMAELTLVEDELRGLLKALNEAQAAQVPVRAVLEGAEREASRLRKRAQSLDATLAVSTANARELAALQHEVAHVKELLEQSEDQELEYLLAVEPLDDVVRSVKERAQPMVARRSELQAIITELQVTLDDELVALRSGRATRAAEVAPALLAVYDAALVRAGTSGAAQVDAGRCDGCRIALSPLDLDRWKAQPANSFMPCPECGRLLLP